MRSLQIWVPALALLGAFGIALVALTVDRAPAASAPAVEAAEVTNQAPARPVRVSLPSKEVADPPPPSPTGILTYVTGDGVAVAVDAGDLASTIEITEDPTSNVPPAGQAGIYPSPDGRYEAAVRSDRDGVWLDLRSGDRLIGTYGIAGPDDPEVVPGPKALAAAVEGVPLTVAWAPDSERLAFGSITGAPWSLIVIRARTGERTWREVAGGYVGELAWAPDSSQLAISTYEIGRKNHTVLVYDSKRSAVRRLIDGCEIVWAPDGRFLAVHREPSVETGVWIVSPDGETLIEASSDASAFPLSWTERAS